MRIASRGVRVIRRSRLGSTSAQSVWIVRMRSRRSTTRRTRSVSLSVELNAPQPLRRLGRFSCVAQRSTMRRNWSNRNCARRPPERAPGTVSMVSVSSPEQSRFRRRRRNLHRRSLSHRARRRRWPLRHCWAIRRTSIVDADVSHRSVPSAMSTTT